MLTNLACTNCFQVIKKMSFLMTKGHEILHVRVKLGEFYFNNDAPYLLFIFIPIKWCTNLQTVPCKNFDFPIDE